jgi:hypothetical protein
MNWAYVLSVVLGAGSLYIAYYGAQLANTADNDQTSKEVNKKFDSVLAEIAIVKKSLRTPPNNVVGKAESLAPPHEAAQQKLANIEQDFSRWASNFIKERDLKKSELERTKLEERNKELEISRSYRKVFQEVIDILRAAVKAYNASAETNFDVQLPDLPVNLYDIHDQPTEIGNVKFRDGTRWRVRLWSERPVHETRLPHLDLVIEDAAFAGNDVVQIMLIPPDYTIASQGGGIVTAADLNTRKPIDSYQQTLRPPLQRLIETQIAALPQK